MRKLGHRTFFFAGALIMVFGLACLNYTKVGSLERHHTVAAQRGWPPPSPTIAYLGMAMAPSGAAMMGWSFGRSKKLLIGVPRFPSKTEFLARNRENQTEMPLPASFQNSPQSAEK